MKPLDTYFFNGNVYTMEKEGKRVSSFGIRDGKFVEVGDDPNQIPPSQEVVDLKGKTVIPGLVDAHMHMYAYCQNLLAVDLSSVKSIDELISLMKNQVEKTPKGQWVKGVNFDQTNFCENRMPTREDLDKISTEHPVTVRRVCLHAVVVNSLGLEKAGVDENYVPEGGGVVEKDSEGKPNGILREQCTQVIDNSIEDPLLDETVRDRVMTEVFSDMSSKGITGIHTYSAKIWKYQESLETYQKREKEGRLPLRVTVCLDELFDPPVLSDEQKSNPYRLTQLGAYKLFTDGSLGAGSAALREPYQGTENMGVMICTQEELNKKIEVALNKGLQIAIHAIGDRALDMTLTAIERGLEVTNVEVILPIRLIHAQMTPPDLLKRMKALPLVIDIQPIFLRTDLHWIEGQIGKQRTDNSYMWKTMYDAGFIEMGGSDCPVESYDPLQGIHCAVTRQNEKGFPEGGFLPKEKLSIYEAVSLFTKNAHYGTGQSSQLGLIKDDYFADFIILDRNIFEQDGEGLLSVKVEKTYLAGNQVYARDQK